MKSKTVKYVLTILFLAFLLSAALLGLRQYGSSVTVRLSDELEKGDTIISVTYIRNGERTEIQPVYDANQSASFTAELSGAEEDDEALEILSDNTHLEIILSFGIRSRRGLKYADLKSKAKREETDEGFYRTTLNEKYFTWAYARTDTYARLLRFASLAAVLMAALIYLLVMLLIRMCERTKEEKAFVSVIWRVLLAILVLIACLLPCALNIMKEDYGSITMEQLVYTLQANLGGTNWGQFNVYLKDAVPYLLAGGVVIAAYNILLTRVKKRNGEGGKRRKILLTGLIHASVLAVSLIVIAATILQFFRTYDGINYIISQKENSSIYDEEYVDPASVAITFPEEKKNLIYIFLESMEITHSDIDDGGAERSDTIPNLTSLAQTWDDFGGPEDSLGGAFTLRKSTWTIAGIVSQTAGIPLNIPVASNSTVTSTLLPGAVTIGDILKDEGYKNVFLLGSDASFGNRANYFTGHGDYEILDYNWAIDTGRIPSDYYVWWGYEDKKLFEYAKEELTELSSSGEPFNLTMLTVDTHFPTGYRCEDCEDTYGTYADVVMCSDRRVGDFVEWVMDQDFGKDTVIVIAGDHLFMEDEYFADIPEDYERRTYFAVINSSKEEGASKRVYCTQDAFPTTLSAMGASIEGDRLGIGTDLYSDTPTLLERRDIDEIDEEIGMNSRFYNSHFLGY